MGTTRPAPDRPCPATLVARARRQEPGRPRLWGRLLAAGVTVVLVAALVPSARADSDGGDSTLVPVDTPAEDAVTEVPAPAEVPAPEHGSSSVAATDDRDPDAWQQAEAPVVDDGGLQGQQPGDLERGGVTGDRLVQAQQDLDEVQQEIDQAEGLLEELEARPPLAPAAAADAGGDAGGEAGSDGGGRTAGQEQQPTREPGAVAQLRPEGQQPDLQPDLATGDVPGAPGREPGGEPGGDQDVAVTGGAGTEDEPAAGRQGEPGTVGQDQAGGGPGGCTSGCSAQPPNAGDSTVAAAGGWWGWGRALLDRVRGVLGGRQPRRLLELEPTVVMDLIQEDLARVSDLQQQLAAEGGTPSQSDLDAARRLLNRARGAIEPLGPQVEGTPEGGERFAALAQQAEELTQAVGDPARQGELMLDIDINDPTVDRSTRERLMTQALERSFQRGPGRIDEVIYDLATLEAGPANRLFPPIPSQVFMLMGGPVPQERWATAQERARDQELVAQVRQGLEELRPELEGTAQEPLFRALAARFQLIQERLGREPATPWQGTEADQLQLRVVEAETLARAAPTGNWHMLHLASQQLTRLRTDFETRRALAAELGDAPSEQRWVELAQTAEAAAASVSRDLEAWAASPPMIQAERAIFSLEHRLWLRGGGRWATAYERRDDLAEFGRARAAIEQLQAQVAEEPAEAAESDQRLVAGLTARLQALQRQLDSEPATPWRGTALDRLEGAIRAVEYFGSVPGPGGDAMNFAAEHIRRLGPRVAEGDPRSDRFRDLTERFQRQQQLEAYTIFAFRRRASASDLQNLQMRAVDPQVVLPPTGGHTGLTDEEKQQFQQLPGAPLTQRTLRDLQLPGAPLTGERPDAHTHLAQATDGATGDQRTITGWSASATGWLEVVGGVGLTLAAIAALFGRGRGGGGSACYAVLAPVLSRLAPASARPQPVYGPEQG